MTDYHIYHPIRGRDSATVAASSAATQAKAKDKKVCNFTFGDVTLKPTAQEMAHWEAETQSLAAAHPEDKRYKLLEGDPLSYAPADGGEGFCVAAAHEFKKSTGLDAGRKEMAACTGGKGGLAGVFCNSFSGKHPVRIVVADPSWVSNFDIPSIIQGRTDDIELICVDTGNTGIIQPQQLRDVMQAYDGEIDCVFVNSFGNNPTSNAYTYEQNEEIAAIVRDSKAMLLKDAAYEGLDFGEPVTPGPNERELHEAGRRAEVFTAAKKYGMAGEKIGYVVSKNPKVIDSVKFFNSQYAGLNRGAVNTYHAAMIAGQEFVDRNRQKLMDNVQLVKDGVASTDSIALEGIPQGTLYANLSIEGLKGKYGPFGKIETPDDARRLMTEHFKAHMVPMEYFYSPNSPNAQNHRWEMRMSFGGEGEDINRFFGAVQAFDRSQQRVNPDIGRAKAQD